jgi:hypothetical protein
VLYKQSARVKIKNNQGANRLLLGAEDFFRVEPSLALAKIKLAGDICLPNDDVGDVNFELAVYAVWFAVA